MPSWRKSPRKISYLNPDNREIPAQYNPLTEEAGIVLPFVFQIEAQINICRIFLSLEDVRLFAAVETLEALMINYLDDEYKNEINELKGKVRKEVLSLSILERANSEETVKYHLGKFKFRSLMLLCGRANILPPDRRVYSEEGLHVNRPDIYSDTPTDEI